MKTKYVMISPRLENELIDKVKAWVEEQGYSLSVLHVLVEYEANKKGFTIYPSKASYKII